jgi:ubiquitin-protein ligase
MSIPSLAKMRINKDMKEIINNPLEGIGIAPIDDSLMRYVINMRLMAGPYEGYCVQLLLIFSDNYPTKPPKILIYPNQAINRNYHHHIFIGGGYFGNEDYSRYKKFCFDLLDNDFMPTNEAKTGWNPSYSISSLLLQVQNFIADPDMGGHVPSKQLIQNLFDSMNTYTNTFNIKDENGKTIQKIHTWKNPYPEMYFKQKEKEKEKEDDIKENDEDNNLEQIKENLTCFMLKVNYIDDPEILLGYPIVRNQINIGRKNRLELYPIPELLTYDGFEAQKSLQQQMVQQYFGNINQFKSANNEYYNSWLPIYINKDHYEKNKERILNSIAEISSNTEFKAEQILQVFPIILNSMIIGMSKGKTSLSSSFIKCYFHYILLFKKMCQEYEIEYSIYLNDIFSKIKENKYIVNKNIIPDIGNFFMVLLFNRPDINKDTFNKIYNSLFEDFIIRQMFWMFHSDESKEDMKNLILRNKNNRLYLEEFEKNKDFKMNRLDEFNQDIKDKNIYKEIIDIISTDKGYLEHIFLGKEKARELAEKRISQSFKRLFQECSREGKDKLKDIILKNLYFPDYFQQVLQKNIELYDKFKVNELLKDLSGNVKAEFLSRAFESQKGNKLLFITFFAQKKIEEEGFLDNLEKNYGVYLDVDNFIQEMNQKSSEIKSFQALMEYVGADFIKDEKGNNKYKDDLELIIDMYGKALQKKYFGNTRDYPKSLGSSFSSRINNSNRNQNQNRYRYKNDRHSHRHGGSRRRRSRSRSRSYSDSDYS